MMEKREELRETGDQTGPWLKALRPEVIKGLKCLSIRPPPLILLLTESH